MHCSSFACSTFDPQHSNNMSKGCRATVGMTRSPTTDRVQRSYIKTPTKENMLKVYLCRWKTHSSRARSSAPRVQALRMHLLVPGLMSDMSIRGPVFWMRAGWWTDTPVQKLWGFPVWLNSVSVTGIVALSSPGGVTAKVKWTQTLQTRLTKCRVAATAPPSATSSPLLTDLLDAFFIFDQQLHPRDVNV